MLGNFDSIELVVKNKFNALYLSE